jgi:hypothetical protein
MYNLIQIKDALKGMTPDQVMKYVNGTNPEVPSYLALSELNRRKQLQDTASEFYGNPSTVKDQIASSLNQAPQGVNPAAGLAGINPTVAPPQVNPASVPPQLAVQQPVPVNPAAAPQQMPMPKVNTAAGPEIVAAAQGGLTSLPVEMFKRSNYAGGGIVAFDSGGSAFTEDLNRAQEWATDKERIWNQPPSALVPSFVQEGINYFTKPRSKDAESQEGGFYGKSGSDNKGTPPPTAEAKPTENVNKQASNTTSGQIKPPAIPQRPPEMTDEQWMARIEKLNKLAGLEGDPYADIKKRYADIEGRRAKQGESDFTSSIGALLRGYAQANPTDAFGVQIAAGGDKMAALDKETAALRDKQDIDMAGLQGAIAKEELARKQGNVKGVLEAQKDQRDYQAKMRKLDIDEQVARAQVAHYGSMGANAGLKENPLVTAATKYYFENQMIPQFKKDFPTVGDYLKSQGLTPHANVGSSPSTNAPQVGTMKDGYRFKGGNPADKNNWEKV